MRVVVLGATGNVGTAVLGALGGDPEVESVVGVARRTPTIALPKVVWRAADIVDADLIGLFEGADAIVHLAWLIQPSRDESTLRAVNVDGSRRVFEAVAAAGVPKLVYASSVGAYSEGPKDRTVDESWPTEGVQTSFYSRHKAEVECLLDEFEDEHPECAVVRLRPALIFRKEAAAGIRRLFLGPLFPGALARESAIRGPELERLRFQAVHGADVAEAYRLALRRDARGPYNVAADPVLDTSTLAELFDARPVRVPAAALRGAASITWRMRAQPSPPGWVDMALAVPLLDSTRARAELGWRPRFSSTDASARAAGGPARGRGVPDPAPRSDDERTVSLARVPKRGRCQALTITDTAARGREVVDEAVSSYVSHEFRPAGGLFVLGGGLRARVRRLASGRQAAGGLGEQVSGVEREVGVREPDPRTGGRLTRPPGQSRRRSALPRASTPGSRAGAGRSLGRRTSRPPRIRTASSERCPPRTLSCRCS